MSEYEVYYEACRVVEAPTPDEAKRNVRTTLLNDNDVIHFEVTMVEGV